MALTARKMIDQPTCLMVAYVDESKGDGAVGKIEIVNRTTTKTIYVYAVYQGTRIERAVPPGPMVTFTFKGNQPDAGDITEIGVY